MFDVAITDGETHQVALYALDWDGNNSRSERIDVRDGDSGALLDSRTLSTFSSGQYLVWAVTGHVTFNVSRVTGSNAVVSAIFC
jgi:hypothetical protein